MPPPINRIAAAKRIRRPPLALPLRTVSGFEYLSRRDLSTHWLLSGQSSLPKSNSFRSEISISSRPARAVSTSLGRIPSVSGGGGSTGAPGCGGRKAPDCLTLTGFLITGNGFSDIADLRLRGVFGSTVSVLRELRSTLDISTVLGVRSRSLRKSKVFSESSGFKLSRADCMAEGCGP